MDKYQMRSVFPGGKTLDEAYARCTGLNRPCECEEGVKHG